MDIIFYISYLILAIIYIYIIVISLIEWRKKRNNIEIDTYKETLKKHKKLRKYYIKKMKRLKRERNKYRRNKR